MHSGDLVGGKMVERSYRGEKGQSEHKEVYGFQKLLYVILSNSPQDLYKGVIPKDGKTVCGNSTSKLEAEHKVPSTLPVLTCALSPSVTLFCHVVQDTLHSVTVGEGAWSVLLPSCS